MSLTLDRQMDNLFQNGLKIIQSHEQDILLEWNHILLHLENSGRKSATTMQETIDYFSNFLFSDKNRNIEQTTNQIDGPQLSIPFQTDQIIITLLENAVHKVIQSKTGHTYNDHQGVQYLFSVMSEDILTKPYQHYFSVDSFLKNLVFSNQIPIEWAAIVTKQTKSYVVEKYFSITQTSLVVHDEIKADSIYALTELLLSQISKGENGKLNVMSVPHEDVTLLFCIRNEDTSHVMPFITHALQIFQHGKNTFEVTKQEQSWKDSVIMFNETIIRSRNYHDAVENITAGFVNYLPFERCALFSYSVNQQMNFGLFGQRFDNKAIQNITQDMHNLPLIQNNIQLLNFFGKSMDYIQPIYMKDAAVGLPDEYVEQFNLHSVVIAPIFIASSNTFLGAVILDQGPGKQFKVTKETFSALIKFGQSAGEILSKYHQERDKISDLHLSLREIDVLKLIAVGASTIEAASELNLSEYTIRDYISSIMQKMEVSNRTAAVARAIREGFI